jgi:diadenosine tetraphosphate (Ap4A) HIT family hydrolase
MNCPFCSPEIYQQTYFETENEIVIYNNIPILPGHSLIIPKRHIATFNELKKKETKSISNTIKQVTEKLKLHHNATGCNVAWNDGEDAGQTIPHLHIHILPRRKNDMDPDPRNLYYRTAKERKQLSEEEMKEITTHLRLLFQ